MPVRGGGDDAAMPMRAPIRLWKMLWGESWRLVVLVTAALTAIVAFAAGVRPLAEGQLGPVDALRFMGLSVVPMLQFTAPFAAGFAATLVHHRFAAENEALAASAAGISHRRVLAPAVALGLTLALAVAGLANFIIPTFLQSIERLITRDVAQVMISAIERGESAEFNGLVIHADRAIRGERDAAHGVTDRVFLFGVVAYDAGDAGDIRAEVAAERAEALLTRERVDGEPVTVVRMRLEGAVGRQAGEGLGEVGAITIGPWIVPNAFRDSPDLYTFTGLRELRRSPERNGAVDTHRRRLAAALHARRVGRLIDEALAGEGRLTLRDAIGSRLSVWAREARAEDGRRRLVGRDGAGVAVDLADTGGAERRLVAEDAWITVATNESGGPASISLELERVAVVGDEAGTRERRAFEALTLDADSGGLFYDAPAADLLAEAARVDHARADDRLLVLSDALEGRIARLEREILAIHNERFALAAACLFIAALGAVVALRRRDGMPLQVYLWSFFPALGAVVTISGGENVAGDNPALGLAVLWGGVATLGAYTLVELRALGRH